MRRIALSLAILAAPATAYAHAQLRHAEPAVGSTVQTAPTQVDLLFSEAVEPRFSTIEVSDAAGHPVDKHDVHVPGADAHHLVVTLATLPPGRYKVVWHATSVDTHKTDGSFTFTVQP